MKVFLGADHAGFEVKEKIKEFLKYNKIQYSDLGAKELVGDDDYPDFAFAVAEKVSGDKNSRGILFCSTGEGMEISANKVDGIRAITGYNIEAVELSRMHNDSNVICFGTNLTPINEIKTMIKKWLKTEFTGAIRHRRRLYKIKEYESR
jgi:ribose 5-phosphate isomerase B